MTNCIGLEYPMKKGTLTKKKIEELEKTILDWCKQFRDYDYEFLTGEEPTKPKLPEKLTTEDLEKLSKNTGGERMNGKDYQFLTTINSIISYLKEKEDE